ncbi:MAG: hypothetical protein FWC74_01390 [Candidatus Bathyarchaeota archaeon]|nr:hypothetical protein [Candidatus Termitimicrobium sp.]
MPAQAIFSIPDGSSAITKIIIIIAIALTLAVTVSALLIHFKKYKFSPSSASVACL